jgi:hypothetical protein
METQQSLGRRTDEKTALRCCRLCFVAEGCASVMEVVKMCDVLYGTGHQALYAALIVLGSGCMIIGMVQQL